uniref:DUF1772 domain-containing protein n=1 Tax=Ditylenchus dipsaci TaxID=166011 RepID=A0A915CR52_9BILA
MENHVFQGCPNASRSCSYCWSCRFHPSLQNRRQPMVGGIWANAVYWPYTMLCIMPVNNELNAIPNELATKPRITDLMHQWGNLHAVRTVLGVAAVGAFVWTLNSAK